MILKKDEHELVEKLVKLTGLEWFSLTQVNGEDFVKDTETGKLMSLCQGLSLLYDSISNEIILNLSGVEKYVFKNLFDVRVGVDEITNTISIKSGNYTFVDCGTYSEVCHKQIEITMFCQKYGIPLPDIVIS